MRTYQRCTRCVMDTTDSKITFDENGDAQKNVAIVKTVEGGKFKYLDTVVVGE